MMNIFKKNIFYANMFIYVYNLFDYLYVVFYFKFFILNKLLYHLHNLD